MRLCENAVSCADTLWKPVLAGTLAGKELGAAGCQGFSSLAPSNGKSYSS